MTKAVILTAYSIKHFAKCWQKKVIHCAIDALVCMNGTKINIFPDFTKH